jgi:hypothetical protein
MVWLNPYDSKFEAELSFPLPEGGAVCGYSVDIENKLVPGVIVTKEKARATFEAEVRKDRGGPAIIEQSVGNIFNTRINPFQPNGSRTIQVIFTQDLISTRRADGSVSNIYTLPFLTPTSNPCFATIKATVPSYFEPSLSSNHYFIDELTDKSPQWRKVKDDQIGKYQFIFSGICKTWSISSPLSIIVIGSLVDSSIVCEHCDDDTISIAASVSDIPISSSKSSSSASPWDTSAKIGLLWDTSKSRGSNQSDRDLELTALEALLKHFEKTSAGQNFELDLFTFNVEPSESPVHYNHGALTNVISKLKYSDGIVYHGGTNYNALNKLVNPDASMFGGLFATYKFWIVVTDGISTFGSQSLPDLQAPCYLLSAATSGDPSFLRQWARRSNGKFFNLRSTDIGELIKGLSDVSTSFLFATLGGNSNFSNSGMVNVQLVTEATPVKDGFEVLPLDSQICVIPSGPKTLDTSKMRFYARINFKHPKLAEVLAAGKELSSVQLSLHFGIKSTAQVTHKHTFELDLLQILSMGIPKPLAISDRAWAQGRLNEVQEMIDLLGKNTESTEKTLLEREQLALSRHYTIVTPNTSLIVLETLQQFLDHMICPPTALPDIYKQYNKRIAARIAEEEGQRFEKTSRVHTWWQRRQKWADSMDLVYQRPQEDPETGIDEYDIAFRTHGTSTLDYKANRQVFHHLEFGMEEMNDLPVTSRDRHNQQWHFASPDAKKWPGLKYDQDHKKKKGGSKIGQNPSLDPTWDEFFPKVRTMFGRRSSTSVDRRINNAIHVLSDEASASEETYTGIRTWGLKKKNATKKMEEKGKATTQDQSDFLLELDQMLMDDMKESEEKESQHEYFSLPIDSVTSTESDWRPSGSSIRPGILAARRTSQKKREQETVSSYYGVADLDMKLTISSLDDSISLKDMEPPEESINEYDMKIYDDEEEETDAGELDTTKRGWGEEGDDLGIDLAGFASGTGSLSFNQNEYGEALPEIRRAADSSLSFFDSGPIAESSKKTEEESIFPSSMKKKKSQKNMDSGKAGSKMAKAKTNNIADKKEEKRFSPSSSSLDGRRRDQSYIDEEFTREKESIVVESDVSSLFADFTYSPSMAEDPSFELPATLPGLDSLASMNLFDMNGPVSGSSMAAGQSEAAEPMKLARTSSSIRARVSKLHTRSPAATATAPPPPSPSPPKPSPSTSRRSSQPDQQQQQPMAPAPPSFFASPEPVPAPAKPIAPYEDRPVMGEARNKSRNRPVGKVLSAAGESSRSRSSDAPSSSSTTTTNSTSNLHRSMSGKKKREMPQPRDAFDDQDNDKVMAKQDTAIANLEENMRDIHAISLDIASMVSEQGSMVDNIESNISDASFEIDSAVHELKTAQVEMSDAFSPISNGFSAVGGLVGGLFGSFGKRRESAQPQQYSRLDEDMSPLASSSSSSSSASSSSIPTIGFNYDPSSMMLGQSNTSGERYQSYPQQSAPAAPAASMPPVSKRSSYKATIAIDKIVEMERNSEQAGCISGGGSGGGDNVSRGLGKGGSAGRSSRAADISEVNSQIDSLKNVMNENIERIIQRGERLESLDAISLRSEELTMSSNKFMTRASQLNRRMWWKNVKMFALLALALLAIGGIGYLVYAYFSFIFGIAKAIAYVALSVIVPGLIGLVGAKLFAENKDELSVPIKVLIAVWLLPLAHVTCASYFITAESGSWTQYIAIEAWYMITSLLPCLSYINDTNMIARASMVAFGCVVLDAVFALVVWLCIYFADSPHILPTSIIVAISTFFTLISPKQHMLKVWIFVGALWGSFGLYKLISNFSIFSIVLSILPHFIQLLSSTYLWIGVFSAFIIANLVYLFTKLSYRHRRIVVRLLFICLGFLAIAGITMGVFWFVSRVVLSYITWKDLVIFIVGLVVLGTLKLAQPKVSLVIDDSEPFGPQIILRDPIINGNINKVATLNLEIPIVEEILPAPEVSGYDPDLSAVPTANSPMMNQYDLVQFDRPRFAFISATPEGTGMRIMDFRTEWNVSNIVNGIQAINLDFESAKQRYEAMMQDWQLDGTTHIATMYQIASSAISPTSISDEQPHGSFALTVLSNLAEGHLGKVQLIRAAAYKLEECGMLEEATHLYRRVLELRGEEPQSYRDLALVLAKLNKYEECIALFDKILTRCKPDWDARFSQIEVVALMDLCGIIPHMNQLEIASGFKIPYSIVPAAANPVQVDMRGVLTWDVDGLDVELQVLEPNGDVLNSFSNQSANGGMLSRDFTGGYGPIEYLAKRAFEGRYAFRAKIRSPCSKPILGGEVTLRFTLYTNFGLPEKQRSESRIYRFAPHKGQLVNLATTVCASE